jgi:two-component system, LytTR family, response regulator
VTIRALVVDDEPLARRGICARLDRAGGIDVVGECGGGREAIRAIQELHPDLVFLDVQMPGIDGFAVVDQIGAERMPPVIFVTAYDEHALRAFDAQALDYLLKPVDDERFERMLERARRRVAERRESAVGRRVAGLVGDLDTATATAAVRQPDGRLLIKERGRVVLVDIAEVDWVEAEGDYVRLHVAGRSHLLRETMAAMERRLDPIAFSRIHRSTIVNVSRIAELRPVTAREWQVVLRDGRRLALSRRYRARVSAQLGRGA